jgi:YfdX protein
MKSKINIWVPVMIATFLLLCFGTIACSNKQNSGTTSAAASTTMPAQTPTQPDFEKQRQNAEQQVRPEVEKERKEAEEAAGKSLDQDAIAAIAETQSAIDAIASNKPSQALEAIERATGKINVLLARNPATALIPVSVQVEIIDAAPHEVKAVKQLADQASAAVAIKDYPAARVVLYALTSEIHVRTYNLPLATYPDALKDAARLLDQKKNEDAGAVLLTALNTVLAVDRVTPLPLVLAREALNAAQAQSQKDKAAAQTLVQTAKNEIARAKELGYAAQAPDYEALNTDISNLEKQLKGNSDAGSVFARLEDRLSSFMKRQSQQERR